MIVQSTTLDTMEKVIALYGGSAWTKIEGRVLIGDGTGIDSNNTSRVFTVKATGGEYTHKITVAESASHSHNWSQSSCSNPGNHKHSYAASGVFITNASSGSDNNACIGYNVGYDTSDAGSHTHNVAGSNSNTGGNGYHNNIQPYKVVYIWERTA